MPPVSSEAGSGQGSQVPHKNPTTPAGLLAREGAALCQGIIHCGGCGRPMNVHHVHGRPSYECSRGRAGHVATPGCRPITAATIDPAVAGCLLAALSGQEAGLALAAADQVTDRRTRAVRAAELAVERARYEAGRAERALGAFEPENRLVARTFEARFEAKLQELAEAQAALTTVTASQSPAAAPSGTGGRRGHPRRAVAGAHYYRPGPETAAAHPDR